MQKGLHMDDILFEMDGLKLTDDEVGSPYGTYTIEDIPDRRPLRTSDFPPDVPLIIQKLCRAALYDVESNIQHVGNRRYFAAGQRGRRWDGMIFIRDVTFSGLLGLNTWYPEVMADSFAYMRETMRKVGAKNPTSHRMEGYDEFEVMEGTFQEFKDKYNTPPFARWTDGMNAVWGMADLLKKTGADTEACREVYTFSKQIYERCFAPLYDPEDGLYRGQASFVDIGHTGYPEAFGRNKSSVETPESPSIYNNALQIKATSTNSLYVVAFDKMAEMADRLGREQEARRWQEKRHNLREAIKDQLRFSDGTLTYFKHPDGHLEPRQHALGTAFAILSGALEGEDAVRAIREYPVRPYGVPLHDPFYDNCEAYHNNAAWPFVDNFFLKARQQATGEDESMRRIALLAGAFTDGSFHEQGYINNAQATLGGPAQLWSAAPVINAAITAGFVESSDSFYEETHNA